jgi:hypothetical protein
MTPPRLAACAVIAATVADCFLHHVKGDAIVLVALVMAGCLPLIWFPQQINDATLGTWSRGGMIDKPTPAIMIAGIGWLALLTVAIAINVGLFRGRVG